MGWLGREHASTPQSGGGGSSPVKTEPPQIVLLLLLLLLTRSFKKMSMWTISAHPNIAIKHPLASSQLHQPGSRQGSGPDWPLSFSAHDKRASHRGSVVVVVVVVRTRCIRREREHWRVTLRNRLHHWRWRLDTRRHGCKVLHLWRWRLDHCWHG